jgi:uncharacterized protein (TIGR02996 family)
MCAKKAQSQRMTQREQDLLVAIATRGDEARYVYADWLSEEGREQEALTQRGMVKFVRRVDFLPAYNKPRDKGGIGDVRMAFYLIGPEGAVQFLTFTKWYTPDVQDRFVARAVRDERTEIAVRALLCPLPADLGYHSKRPMYEGHSLMDKKCHLLNGPCYYAGSGLNAQRYFELLVTQGSNAVWKELEGYYANVFEGKNDD